MIIFLLENEDTEILSFLHFSSPNQPLLSLSIPIVYVKVEFIGDGDKVLPENVRHGLYETLFEWNGRGGALEGFWQRNDRDKYDVLIKTIKLFIKFIKWNMGTWEII